MDKINKSRRILLKGIFLVLMLPFLSACNSSTSSSKSSSSSAKPSVSMSETATSSSSQISHTSNPTRMDLMAQIWYSKGRMDYVTFDETKMTMWSRYSIKSNILPTSHPYSSDMSTITLDFGVTGVDNQFLLTWEGDMIVMSPIGHGDEYGKAHADYLIPINNREELDKVMPD